MSNPENGNGRTPTTAFGLFAEGARRWGVFAAMVIALTAVQVFALKTLYESQRETEIYVRTTLTEELHKATETRVSLTKELDDLGRARERMLNTMDRNSEVLNRINATLERQEKRP